MILKKYTNMIYQTLQDFPLDINLFTKAEKEDDKNQHSVVIELKGHPLWFEFRNSSNDFNKFDCRYTKFAPSFPATEYIPSSNWGTFDDVIAMFERWLNEVITYMDELTGPDLWMEFVSSEKALNLSDIDFKDKEYFNADEKKQIKLALSDLKLLLVKNFKPNDEELKSLDARLEYLGEAMDRLNKFDWKSLLISMIFSISIALSLDSEKGKQLFLFFKQVFEVIPKLHLPH